MKKIYSLVAFVYMLFSATAIFSQVPSFSHIVIVVGENTASTAVFGSSNAPYINALAAQGAKFTNSFALSHPSQPNYLQLYSGSNQGVTTDGAIASKFTTANLGSELITAGKTYITYSDGLPSVGYDGTSSGSYVRKHNPAANWMGNGTNQISTTTNQPFTAFPTNFNSLPSVCFVMPDLCHDGHDSCAPLNNTILQYDTWISQNLDAYKQWCINNNSLLIVTYDEDDFTPTNKIATVFYGARVLVGEYAQTINHYNLLRTIEDSNALSSHAGSAATATPIDYCWTTLGIGTTTRNELKIVPNPVGADFLNFVDSQNTGLENNQPYTIVNMLGQKMTSGIIENDRVAITDLDKGIYCIEIAEADKIIVEKFIKE
ncbi:alkaline phosphatase family protein [Flavobacterium sp. N1994]|uniref:alkaline phosphatase family protein n=1 Tax=Flavobacterium sp. N1994 TaxID=2986827 RepID=UPI002223659C|nr:alkaline phosphatase family protein [Flavobacterium sp. N1994]